MIRARRIALMPTILALTLAPAAAQRRTSVVVHDVAFRPPAMSTPDPARPRDAFRYPAIVEADAPRGARAALPLSMQRRTYRFGAAPSLAGPHARPRSRVTQVRLEDDLALGEAWALTVGWRGMKVSNRNANAAGGTGNDRLTAHDWFLPRLAIRYRPAAALTLSLGYRETMRAYDGAGTIGALGLSRPDFDALRARLRPERSRQWQAGGQWLRDDLTLSLGGFHGVLRDALSFGRGYAPANAGSATLSGMEGTLARRLTPHIETTIRYRRAAARDDADRVSHEQEIRLAGSWTAGPWRATIGASRLSVATLLAVPDARRALRFDAGIDHVATGLIGRPVTFSLRVTDPSPLASARLNDESGGVRATDRARAVMLGVASVW